MLKSRSLTQNDYCITLRPAVSYGSIIRRYVAKSRLKNKQIVHKWRRTRIITQKANEEQDHTWKTYYRCHMYQNGQNKIELYPINR